MNFRDVLQTIKETNSGDIATVTTKIGSKPLRHQGSQGKKCKAHKRVNCEECRKD